MRFQGRLGIQQRVLPAYRVPFFEQLASSCDGGLCLIAGMPRPSEGIEDAGSELKRAALHRVANVHIGGMRQYLLYQRATLRWFNEWMPDVLVMEASVRTVSNRALLAAAHASGRPVVGWGLGVLPWTDVPGLEHLRRSLLFSNFSRFDAMIAYSSKAKSDYMALGIPGEKIRVAPNSTTEVRVALPKGLRNNSPDHDAAIRRELGIGDKSIVVFVGRLVAGKRVDRLIRAFDGLQDDAELVIVGDGAERRSLERLARERHVPASFPGDRRANDLDRIMAAADLFVLPGLGGLALQEAVCWGLPVVVAGGDGSERDLVQHNKNGLLIPSADESGLRDAIRLLARSPDLRQRMGGMSLELIQRGFGFTAMLREFVGALNDIHLQNVSHPMAISSPSSMRSAVADRRMPTDESVIVVCKNPIEDLPPALTSVHCLSQLTHSVRLLASSVAVANANAFRDRRVQVTEIGSPGRPGTSVVARAAYWRRFRRDAWRAMSDDADRSLLWVSSADTALALGPRLLTKRFVLQINELYDQRPVFRRLLARYAHAARVVVVPESTRASIFRHWYSLRKTPTVIPNKPLLHPRERRRSLDALALPPDVHEALAQRAVLYQGHVDLKRSLLPVAEAFRYLSSEYRLVLMGVDHGAVGELRAACPTLVYIPPIPAPGHLLVTSHATVGVISYGFDSLNDLFCAPNKIWEFAGFGIPVVAQRLPGLQGHVEGFHAGVCVDFDHPQAIAAAIHSAGENQGFYTEGARRLYESVDVEKLFALAVEQAESGQ